MTTVGVLRRVGIALGALPLVLVTVLALAVTPAAAHAVLESSTPAQGSTLEAAPADVTLLFSEDVAVGARSLQVTDARGRRVDSGRPEHTGGDPRTLRVALPGPLARGSYSVTWRVVSADGHPVAGAFAFGVGVAAGTAPEETAVDPVVGAVRTAAELAAYAGSAVVVAGGCFLFLLWPAGQASARMRRVLVAGIGVAAAGAVVTLLVQGPYLAGRGLTAVSDPGLLAETASSSTGRPLLLRVLAVALSVPVLGIWPRLRPGEDSGAGGVAAAGDTLLLAASFALTGHAAEASPRLLAVAADGVHLTAAGLWLGGLVVLVTAFLPEASVADRAAVLPRWSRLAAGCVVALVLTGTYQAWREVRELDALPATSYGRLLLGKLALVALVLVAAAVARRRIPSAVSRLRPAVTAEAALGLAVLTVTSFLVATPPSRTSYAPPFSARLVARDVEGRELRLALDVASTRAGPQEVAVRVTRTDGGPQPYTSVTGELRPVSESAAVPAGAAPTLTLTPGEDAVARGTAVVPGAGRWAFTVHVLTDATTDYTATTTYRVR